MCGWVCQDKLASEVDCTKIARVLGQTEGQVKQLRRAGKKGRLRQAGYGPGLGRAGLGGQFR